MHVLNILRNICERSVLMRARKGMARNGGFWKSYDFLGFMKNFFMIFWRLRSWREVLPGSKIITIMITNLFMKTDKSNRWMAGKIQFLCMWNRNFELTGMGFSEILASRRITFLKNKRLIFRSSSAEILHWREAESVFLKF